MTVPTPITFARLAELLVDQPTQPVTLVTRTVPEMRKRGNPFLERGLYCLACRNGFIGARYQSVVNRQRGREERPKDKRGEIIPFRSMGLWNGQGERVPGNRHLVRHKTKGSVYLVFYPQQEFWRRYETSDTLEILPAEEVEPWLKRSSGSTRQGTEKKIHWKTLHPQSLLRIKMQGNLLSLEGQPA